MRDANYCSTDCFSDSAYFPSASFSLLSCSIVRFKSSTFWLARSFCAISSSSLCFTDSNSDASSSSCLVSWLTYPSRSFSRTSCCSSYSYHSPDFWDSSLIWESSSGSLPSNSRHCFRRAASSCSYFACCSSSYRCNSELFCEYRFLCSVARFLSSSWLIDSVWLILSLSPSISASFSEICRLRSSAWPAD